MTKAFVVQSCRLLVFVFMISGGFSVSQAKADDSETLRIIAELYKANKSSFRSGKCTFKSSIVSADNENDAIRRKWNNSEEHCDVTGTLYFLDDALSIKVDIDNDDLVRRLEESAPMITPVNIVKKGSYAIDHDALVNTAIVHSPNNYALNIRYHPFNLAEDSAFGDPATAIDNAVASNFDGTEFSIEEDVLRGGQSYLLLKKSRRNDSHDKWFYIDPHRGYLPFITEYYHKTSGELFSRMVLLDVHSRSLLVRSFQHTPCLSFLGNRLESRRMFRFVR